MPGTTSFDRSVVRAVHRAAVGMLCVACAASLRAGALPAQGPQRPGGRGQAPNGKAFGPRLRMGMRMRMRGRHLMMMMSDPAARLLDEQSALQLSGSQVSELITLHEATRRQMRTIAGQIRALMPRMQQDGTNQTQSRRPRLTASQRDSLASLVDALRTVRWRATSAADSVLTAEQRRAAVGLSAAHQPRMRGGPAGWGGRRDGTRRMGPAMMRAPRAPTDSASDDE